MPSVRPKLRLALLVTSAVLSGLCGVLMVGTLVARVWIVSGRYEFSVKEDQRFRLTRYWNPARARPFALMVSVRRVAWSERARMFCYYLSVGPVRLTRDGELAHLSVALWLPALMFGLWPGVVAAKTIRRRQQVRGFDVTPAPP
jgi:hypothetical protein